MVKRLNFLNCNSNSSSFGCNNNNNNGEKYIVQCWRFFRFFIVVVSTELTLRDQIQSITIVEVITTKRNDFCFSIRCTWQRWCDATAPINLLSQNETNENKTHNMIKQSTVHVCMCVCATSIERNIIYE